MTYINIDNMKREIKLIKGKKKKRIKIEKMCSYCSYAPALPNDNLCQECRDMINEKSKGFII